MLHALSTARHRHVTVIFVAIFGAAVVGAGAVGFDGHAPANMLVFVAASALILTFVHPWRQTRRFKYLFYASDLCFGAFVVPYGLVPPHALFEVGAGATGGSWSLRAILLMGVQVAYVTAVFVCPPAMAIGLAGALIMSRKDRRGDRPEPRR